MLTKLLNAIGLHTSEQVAAMQVTITNLKSHVENMEGYAKDLEAVIDNRTDPDKPIIVRGHRNYIKGVTLTGRQSLIVSPNSSNNIIMNVEWQP